MSRKPLVMPRLSDTMKEGHLRRWLKKPGDPVRKGEALAGGRDPRLSQRRGDRLGRVPRKHKRQSATATPRRKNRGCGATSG